MLVSESDVLRSLLRCSLAQGTALVVATILSTAVLLTSTVPGQEPPSTEPGTAVRPHSQRMVVRVIDAVSEAPLADREILINQDRRQTDEYGRVSLPQEPEDRRIKLRISGYVTAEFELWWLESDLRVPLIPATSLSGAVRTSDGAPAVRCSVRLKPWQVPLRRWAERAWTLVSQVEQSQGWSVLTNAEGRYQVDGLPTGVALRVVADLPPERGEVGRILPVRANGHIVLEPGKIGRLDLRIPRWRSICGRVTDQRGQAVVGARVRLEPWDWPRHCWRPSFDLEESKTTRTDPQGEFRFHDRAFGKWRLVATSPLRAPLSASFTKATKEIELSESDDSGQCVMSVYRGLTVTGHVRDVEGRPVRRGVVTAYAAGQSVCSARVTGKSGDFHLGPLLLDPIQIRAESWTEKLSITHEFACSRQRTVHAGDRDVTLVVRPGCKITGVIESAKSGDSQTVYVEMVRPGASRFGSWHSEHVHDDGTFSLFVHEPGNYDLVAYDAKRKLLCEVRDLQVDEGDIRAGKTRSLGPVPVQATGLVRLVLRWADMRMVRRELVLHVKHAGREYHGRPLCQMTTEVAVPSGKSRVTLVQNSAYSNEAPRTTILDTEVEVEVGRSMEVQAELRR